MPIVYVTSAGDRRIHVLDLDRATGKVSPIAITEVPGPDQHDAISLPLALSEDKRFLYAAIRTPPYPASTFAIDPASGQLTHLGSANLPDGMAYIAPDRTNGWLLQASYTGSKLAVSPIGGDGRIREPASEVFDVSRAHSIVPSRDNRFAYVASHGRDMVLQYSIDVGEGKLIAADPAGAATVKGGGPRHLVIDTPHARLYALNESNGSVASFAIDPRSGGLTPLRTVSMLPAGYTSVPTAADIHLTRDGQRLYASERTESFLAIFDVDPPSGGMVLVDTVRTEESPRGFAIDSSDRFLLCAGQFSGALSVYSIEAKTGRLTQTDRRLIGPNANWVEIIDLH